VSLHGKIAVVTGADQPVVGGLAGALRQDGAAVGLLGDPQPDFDLAAPCDLGSRDSVEAAMSTIAASLGGPVDVVVHGAMAPTAYERCAFEDVTDERWDTVWEQTMLATIAVLQSGFTQMRGRGGRIVLVTSTVSMSGAEQLVPYTAAVEGQRLLAKSAARQWGAEGVTVNCVAAAPEHVPIGVASTDVSLAPAALGGPGDPVADLGPVVVFLASDASHFVTGITLCADGGVWMAP
jgi:NAD(P)-dependent dehydrogenase (short-subunit alcohol dehydrogenase family)